MNLQMPNNNVIPKHPLLPSYFFHCLFFRVTLSFNHHHLHMCASFFFSVFFCAWFAACALLLCVARCFELRVRCYMCCAAVHILSFSFVMHVRVWCVFTIHTAHCHYHTDIHTLMCVFGFHAHQRALLFVSYRPPTPLFHHAYGA